MSENVSFQLRNQDGDLVTDSDFRGRRYVMYFYPVAMTSGCTLESCDFRDSFEQFAQAGYDIIGVSPDPPARNKEFKDKEGLNFDLLSDEEHELADALGAWGEKKVHGQVKVGLIRSTFVVDENGELAQAYRNVRAEGHVARVKEDLLG